MKRSDWTIAGLCALWIGAVLVEATDSKVDLKAFINTEVTPAWLQLALTAAGLWVAWRAVIHPLHARLREHEARQRRILNAAEVAVSYSASVVKIAVGSMLSKEVDVALDKQLIQRACIQLDGLPAQDIDNLDAISAISNMKILLASLPYFLDEFAKLDADAELPERLQTKAKALHEQAERYRNTLVEIASNGVS